MKPLYTLCYIPSVRSNVKVTFRTDSQSPRPQLCGYFHFSSTCCTK